MTGVATYHSIPLTKGEVALIDDVDVDLIAGPKWCSNSHGYAVRRIPGGGGALEYMHRIIASAPPGLEVDHINGDSLDNRRANLRLCRHAENQCNQRLPSHNTSGYKGVTWDGHRHVWAAYIHHGRKWHLGHFRDAVSAALAYDAAAREHFGEFARPNFPEETS